MIGKGLFQPSFLFDTLYEAYKRLVGPLYGVKTSKILLLSSLFRFALVDGHG